jgi:hypothetical protein
LRDGLAILARLGHGDEPLVGEHRFDDHAGTVAAGNLQLVRFGVDEHASGFEVGHDGLAGVEAVEALVLGGGVFVDLGIEGQNADLLEACGAGRRRSR